MSKMWDSDGYIRGGRWIHGVGCEVIADSRTSQLRGSVLGNVHPGIHGICKANWELILAFVVA